MEALIDYVLLFGNLNRQQIDLISGKPSTLSLRKGDYYRYSGEVDHCNPWQTDQLFSWRRGTKNAVVAVSKLNN